MEINGVKVKVTRVPMGRGRNGKRAVWTTSTKENQISNALINGELCSHCLKNIDEDEEVVTPRSGYSDVAYHTNCWDSLPVGWPDW
jgi:hypothetical protein